MQAEEPAPVRSAEEIWQAQVEEALAFLKGAVEYDDSDPIVLDNLGEFYYRVLQDKEQARPWFDKALEEKEGQIDTLWFLSRYDLENGDKAKAIARLEKEMKAASKMLEFEYAALLRDQIIELRKET